MLLDVMEVLSFSAPVIFYYDDHDIVLWKNFVERQQNSKNSMERPKFVRIEDKKHQNVEIM